MVLKWARQGPAQKILATDDFSRLTLHTIALCAMDFRFNSFYQDEMHPFVQSMNAIFAERSQSNQLSGMVKHLLPSYRAELKKNQEHQKTVSRGIVEHRRAHPTEKKDLHNALIHGKDPKTGLTMRDELIIDNMQTFLRAAISSLTSSHSGLNGDKNLESVGYAVFGCGHSDWAVTYQRVPTLVDDLILKPGGRLLVERGFTGASKGEHIWRIGLMVRQKAVAYSGGHYHHGIYIESRLSHPCHQVVRFSGADSRSSPAKYARGKGVKCKVTDD